MGDFTHVRMECGDAMGISWNVELQIKKSWDVHEKSKSQQWSWPMIGGDQQENIRIYGDMVSKISKIGDVADKTC